MQQASDNQSDIVAFLSRPETHGVPGPVDRIDTHISHLFLAGERVLKLKRAVRFAYVDFSTTELRHRYCAAEVTVNRRTAPDLYIGVAPVLSDGAGGLTLGAAMEPDAEPDAAAIDWVVVMRRFDQDCLFDALAQRGGLDNALITGLAEMVAAFHEQAAPMRNFGGADGMRRVIDGNMAEITRFIPDVFGAAAADSLMGALERAFDSCAALLEQRRDAGRVRHCHGDLYLRNICLIDGHPTPFDAIEFNDDIANIDVLYDFAFLLMDLAHRGRRGLANVALNHYLPREGDYDGLAALPLFLACRAAVRAHVTALQQSFASGPDADRLAAEARSYLGLAQDVLKQAAPRLVAIGGLSGTGKSRLARDLAPGLKSPLGAIVLRSDVVRKRLLGADPLTRLDPEAYRAGVTAEVYEAICRQAEITLDAGMPVIADAVYARPEQRAAIEDIARHRDIGFDGLWLEAPEDLRLARIGGRTFDASDADAGVARAQAGFAVGKIDWRCIDASGAPEATLACAQKALNRSSKQWTL
ncbi:MAG: bifunctional aminoglycoside phosphotransferase/ATP-binding protein [Alphaproteobacteria bacterium]